MQIELTTDETLVLFEFLDRYQRTDRLSIEDPAERQALWNLLCLFEKHMDPSCYETDLAEARERVRGEGETPDRTDKYRRIVSRLIEEYANFGRPPDGIRVEAVIDT
jgi:hypothetical protein